MEINIARFLAVTAVLAGAVVSCTVNDNSTNNNATGGQAGEGTGGSAGSATGGSAGSATGGSAGSATGGSAGSATGGSAGSATGGSAGSATGGSAGSATGGSAGSATGGSAGSATGGSAGSGTGGSAGSATGGSAGSGTGGSAGSAGCLGDVASSSVEGACLNLPYINDLCGPSSELPPAGLDICYHMNGRLREGVDEALVACLAAIPNTAADACSPAHDAAADICYSGTMVQACALGEAATICASITAPTACPALAQADCEATFNAFKLTEYQAIIDCANRAGANPAITDTCDVAISNCIWDPTYY